MRARAMRRRLQTSRQSAATPLKTARKKPKKKKNQSQSKAKSD